MHAWQFDSSDVTDRTGAGKSSMTVQFVDGHFVDSYYPTIENTFSKMIKWKNQDFATEIIDTAGQVRETKVPTSIPETPASKKSVLEIAVQQANGAVSVLASADGSAPAPVSTEGASRLRKEADAGLKKGTMKVFLSPRSRCKLHIPPQFRCYASAAVLLHSLGTPRCAIHMFDLVSVEILLTCSLLPG